MIVVKMVVCIEFADRGTIGHQGKGCTYVVKVSTRAILHMMALMELL